MPHMSELAPREYLWQGRRAGLWVGPSQLEHWSRFEQLVGQPTWAKRDDISGLGLGGNKLRKLDLILGSALDAGADTILTTGGVQSNHCRLTAAAVSRLGLEAILFLQGDRPASETGNLLLDLLFGAQIIYTGDISKTAVDGRMRDYASAIQREGRTPYIVPLGAATMEGCVAYVEACQELAVQCESKGVEPVAIVVAVGTGSTLAGLTLGAEQYMPNTRVVGVSVGGQSPKVRSEAIALIREASEVLGMTSRLTEASLDVRTDYEGPAYTAVTSGALAALHALARSEGVLVDVTYTGKALHGLVDLCKRGELGGAVLFWHTGGFPELFSRPSGDVLG
jgi:D-cysteine desulfhydrase family pyridoxal phosphate-dependent enzyme